MILTRPGLTRTLGLGAIALCLCARPASGQQVPESGASALDSLLTIQVSTAAKYDQTRSDAPASVSIVDRSEIRRFGYRTLEDVLRDQVGFYTGNDREHSDVGVRGLGRPGYYNNKVLVLIDGHSLNDNFTGGARVGSAMPVDLDAVERIEIIRGPGSALYGARAMLAVVNLVLRKGRDIDALEATAESGSLGAIGASVSYGKVLGFDRDLSISAAWAQQDGEDLYFRELDSAPLNNGWAEGLDWQDYLRTSMTFRSGGLSLLAGWGERKKGAPAAAYGSSFNHPDAMVSDAQAFLEAGFERRLGDYSSLTVRGYADSNGYEGVYPFGPTSAPTSEATFKVDVGSVGGEVRIEWEPALSQRVVLGVEALDVARAELEAPLDPSAGGSHPYSVLSGFVHEEFQVTPTLLLTLGLRFDRYSSVGSATTPRAALVQHLGPRESTTLKLLYGGAFRAPNLLELYTTSAAAGMWGNPDLKPERIRTLEAVWEQRVGSLSSTVSLFHNDVMDLIDLVPIAVEGGVLDEIAFAQENVTNARADGVEVAVRAGRPSADAFAELGYMFTHGVDRDLGTPLVNSPRHQLRLRASKSFLDRVYLAMTVRAEGRRATLYGSQTEPLAVVDLVATSVGLSERFTLQASASNVFDRTYALPGGFQHVQSVIPQHGRRISFRLGYNW
jgi:iron complex outermembrane receptor protein